MKIDIQIAGTTPGVRSADTVPVLPVLPVAGPLKLALRFGNAGSSVLTVESPDTSQALLLRLLAPAPRGESWYLLNPSQIDATGEITAPLSRQLNLAPGQAVERSIELGQYNLDRWFEPGLYEVWIDYQGVQSNRLRFATELRAESVPRLVELALAGPDDWIREQAMVMLRQLPGGPDLALPAGDAAERDAGKARNADRAALFIADWPQQRQTPAVQDYFESQRVERRGPR